jgi:hypothetical protein
MPKLRDVLPHEFFREFSNTRAATMLDCEISEEHSLVNAGLYKRWPGPAKNVMSWWKLADGRCVGWNENAGRGWSFPVFGKRSV